MLLVGCKLPWNSSANSSAVLQVHTLTSVHSAIQSQNTSQGGTTAGPARTVQAVQSVQVVHCALAVQDEGAATGGEWV